MLTRAGSQSGNVDPGKPNNQMHLCFFSKHRHGGTRTRSVSVHQKEEHMQGSTTDFQWSAK